MKTVEIDMLQVKKIVQTYLNACAETSNAAARGEADTAYEWSRVMEIRNAQIVAMVRIGAISWEDFFSICEQIRREGT